MASEASTDGDEESECNHDASEHHEPRVNDPVGVPFWVDVFEGGVGLDEEAEDEGGYADEEEEEAHEHYTVTAANDGLLAHVAHFVCIIWFIKNY